MLNRLECEESSDGSIYSLDFSYIISSSFSESKCFDLFNLLFTFSNF